MDRPAEPLATLVALRGDDLGRRYDLTVDSSLELGAGPTVNVRRVDGAWVVSGKKVPERTIADGERVTVGAEVFSLLAGDDLDDRHAQLMQRLALVDDATQAFTRRYLDDVLPREIEAARKGEQPLAVVVLAIDLLDRAQRSRDLAWEATLRSIAMELEDTALHRHTVARFDEGSFAVLLPEVSADDTHEWVQRLRHHATAAATNPIGDTRNGLGSTDNFAVLTALGPEDDAEAVLARLTAGLATVRDSRAAELLRL
ncbi:MAG: diguanylate cyclase [Myxococcota bacterium]